MRAGATLTATPGALKADASTQCRPVRRIKRPVFGADRHLLPYAAILPASRSTATRPMARRLAIMPTPNVSYSRCPRPSSENDGLGALDPFPGRVAADVGSIGVAEGWHGARLTGLDSAQVLDWSVSWIKDMASQPGDRSLIASFPSIAFCLLNERPGLRLKHRPISPAKTTLYSITRQVRHRRSYYLWTVPAAAVKSALLLFLLPVLCPLLFLGLVRGVGGSQLCPEPSLRF